MFFLWTVISLLVLASAVPLNGPRPLVLWHGLGDSHSSEGMVEFMDMIKDVHPGIFIHSVLIEEDEKKDREAGFYGDINMQLERVAGQLRGIPELREGFDALGFSQGGQFLRAYVQRYNLPPVNNLITFGSQHMGVSDIPACRPYDVFCQIARRAAKGAVYSDWAQSNLIQAQYFRDPLQLDTYLAQSRFLADINNEIPETRNATYAQNLASLNHLVLILFTEDKTVVPKESSWFGSEVAGNDQSQRLVLNQWPMRTWRARDIIPLRSHPLYTEDWIGLRTLDEQKALSFRLCDGVHMQIGGCWERIVREYTGGRL